jgi:hypothetical protein
VKREDGLRGFGVERKPYIKAEASSQHKATDYVAVTDISYVALDSKITQTGEGGGDKQGKEAGHL